VAAAGNRAVAGSRDALGGAIAAARGSPVAGQLAGNLGTLRESYVAGLIGGRIPTAAEAHITTRFGRVQIDVIGAAGELIEVGGPGKALSLTGWGEQVQRLAKAARLRGVRPMVYLEEGTPQAVIRIARRRLGNRNVVIFRIGGS
jgi:hypothetical protein